MDEKLKALQVELAQVKQQLAVSEMELKAREKVFEAVFDNTIVGYWEWDIMNDKEYLSPSFTMMFGYEFDELNHSTNSWKTIIHQEDLPKVSQLFDRCINNEFDEFYNSEVRYIHKDGSIVDVFCSGRVTERDAEMKPLKIVGSHINISPLKKVQRKLMETTKLLAKQNKQLHDFAYITTHNLRSPIGNLVSLHELHKLSNKQEEKNELMNKLKQVSHQLLGNVNDLSDSLKLQQDNAYEEISFEELSDSVLKQLSVSIERKKAIITSNFDAKASIAYPKIYLESILLNLLSNALKYSSTKRTPQISIYTNIKNEKTLLHVTDNGMGINMEKYGNQLFGLYNTFHDNADAKGIGLFITKTQIESLGGSIAVSSEADKGTTFTITF